MEAEKIPTKIYADAPSASRAVALRIAEIVRERARLGRPAVLGLATGNTPISIYGELMRMHSEEGLDFSGVVTFNLDEYWPIAPEALQSYRAWMQENFFRGVNIKPENIHIPSGTVTEEDIAAHCAEYEDAIVAAGGIDLQILGVGRSGHIGFNEPGSGRKSLTRLIELDTITRKDAASDFFGEENVPRTAITMGVATVMAAKEVCLLAFGEHKAPIIRRAVEGGVSNDVAASFLQEHDNATIYLDVSAGAELTRVATPWVHGACEWDELLQHKAVIWVAKLVGKPILKLTDEDYVEHGLGELVRQWHGCYNLNIHVFRRMMDTITGWPGGREPGKRILVLSPHPDDDVICAGGMMTRMVQQGHQVHTAYMVSGCLSVFDHDVIRYADFVKQFKEVFGLGAELPPEAEQQIERLLQHKKPGEIDSLEIQAIKGRIRRCEALDAAKYCGVDAKCVHFLDLPFYNTGRVQKSDIGDKDIEAVLAVYKAVRPDMIFAAGDMSDPHGTHRLCLQAAIRALELFKAETSEDPEVWLYRGAWQEWPPERVDMTVPLSPNELKDKRYAIFRHQSQKDRAMFPGPYDSREFWQRSEERNMSTAATYDDLGLPEYHAMEAFARWPQGIAAATAAQLHGAAKSDN